MHRSSRRCACCDGRYGDGGAEAAPDDAAALQQDRGGGRRMMPLHYNRTAVVNGTASVHHRLAFMMGCFMDCRAVMDRAAFVYSRSVMGGAALVHHGLCFVMLCAPVHARPLMFGNVLMHGRTVMGGAALVHHRLRLVMLCAPVHAGTLLFGNVLMNRRGNCFYVPGGPAVSVRDAVRRHDGPAPLQKLPL